MVCVMATDSEQPMGQAAFESALDVLAELIGHGQAIISEESGSTEGDASVLDVWRDRVDRWVQVRSDLEPGDNDRIRAVLETDAPFLRSLRDVIDE